jgi:hypothetical protein
MSTLSYRLVIDKCVKFFRKKTGHSKTWLFDIEGGPQSQRQQAQIRLFIVAEPPRYDLIIRRESGSIMPAPVDEEV